MTDSPFADRIAEIADDIAMELPSNAARLHEIVEEMRQPSAGTSAYEMIAAAEIASVETTDTLMQMVAATVLSVLIDEEGGGRSNVSYSPFTMDSMMARYDFTAKRDGMITTVHIKPKPGAFARNGDQLLPTIPGDPFVPMPKSVMYAQEGIDDAPAEPQAEAVSFDRPLWAARVDGTLHPASDRSEAERLVSTADMGQVAQIENRFCYHQDCPAERCNHVPKQDSGAEVTSDS